MARRKKFSDFDGAILSGFFTNELDIFMIHRNTYKMENQMKSKRNTKILVRKHCIHILCFLFEHLCQLFKLPIWIIFSNRRFFNSFLLVWNIYKTEISHDESRKHDNQPGLRYPSVGIHTRLHTRSTDLASKSFDCVQDQYVPPTSSYVTAMNSYVDHMGTLQCPVLPFLLWS